MEEGIQHTLNVVATEERVKCKQNTFYVIFQHSTLKDWWSKSKEFEISLLSTDSLLASKRNILKPNYVSQT